jgi:DNA modification methylase
VALTFETWPIERCIEYARNPRKNDHAVDKVAAAIREFGFRVPICAKSDGTVVDGHLRLKAAKKLGLKEVPVVLADDMSEAQIKAFRLSVNKVAELADWDNELLALEFIELEDMGFDLSLTGFEADEIGALFPKEAKEGLTDDDAVPEVPAVPVAVEGDVWLLGRHRLMCGDSTSIDAVERLMDGRKADMVFTDPPYGVSANGGRSDTVKKQGIKAIANDNLRGDQLEQFIVDALSIVPLRENGSFYVCYDQKTQHEFTGALRSIGWKQRATIIWNKNVFGLSGFKGYRPKFELIAFGHTGDDYTWSGDNSQADVWDIPRPSERIGGHPTPKPIDLVERAINNSSKKGETVADLFGGSGSTLIACEKTARDCRMMELDPKYCDVIIKRWQDFTGQQATLEATGQTFAELSAEREAA